MESSPVELAQADAEAWIKDLVRRVPAGWQLRFEYMNTLPTFVDQVGLQELVFLNTLDMRPRKFASHLCDRIFALRFDMVMDDTWMPLLLVKDCMTYDSNDQADWKTFGGARYDCFAFWKP